MPLSGSKQELSFQELLKTLRKAIRSFPDKRAGRHNCLFSMEEIALSAFAVFFSQSPSFLEFQRRMESAHGVNNVRTLFSVADIPSDNHIRDILDQVQPSAVAPVFSEVLTRLLETGCMDKFRSINNTYLLALDGTQYFTSQQISCQHCSVTHHSNSTVTYSHSMVIPTLVHPEREQVIALAPEFILPQDGAQKQDCETAAAKRLLENNHKFYRELGVTILGDDLYSHQPFCELLLQHQLHFVFTCKVDSHKILYQLIDELESSAGIEKLEVKRKRKRGNRFVIDTYRFANQLPIRSGTDSIDINWCEITTTDQEGKILYHNAFVTDYLISKDNVAQIVAAGRARWKIENEQHNTLKTKGYNLEHNFGHGKQHLSALLATFNVLAYLFHTALEMVDPHFQKLRLKLAKRKTFFEHIRALTCYVCFGSWPDMMLFMLKGLDHPLPPPLPGSIYYADTS